MKKLKLLIIPAAVITIAGIFYVSKPYFANRNQATTLNKIKQEMALSTENANVRYQKVQQLYNSFSSNIKIADAVSKLDGLTLESITAQQYTASGELDNIITVNNCTDVSYFTDTVDCMVFSLHIDDLGKALDSLCNLDVPFTKLQIDHNNANVLLRISAVNFTNSDDSTDMSGERVEQSENTEIVPEVSSENMKDSLDNPLVDEGISYLDGGN